MEKVTIGQLAATPDDVPGLRYHELVAHDSLQYIIEYTPDFVMSNNIELFDWVTGEKYNRDKALRRYYETKGDHGRCCS